MNVNHATQSTDDTIEAILQGGPTDIPHEARLCRAAPTQDKIKLPHRGGYEHFERVDEDSTAGAAPTVFRWTDRTKIAE